jgi:hypothetical protein
VWLTVYASDQTLVSFASSLDVGSSTRGLVKKASLGSRQQATLACDGHYSLKLNGCDALICVAYTNWKRCLTGPIAEAVSLLRSPLAYNLFDTAIASAPSSCTPYQPRSGRGGCSFTTCMFFFLTCFTLHLFFVGVHVLSQCIALQLYSFAIYLASRNRFSFVVDRLVNGDALVDCLCGKKQ